MGIAGARILVHHNAVLAGQTGMGGEFVARHHADADQHDIGVIGLAARDDPFDLAVAFKGFDPSAQLELDPGLLMLGGIERRKLRRHGARHQPVHGFEHRHVQAALGANRRHFQSDIAAADNGNALARLKRRLQPIHIGDGLEIMNAGQTGAGGI